MKRAVLLVLGVALVVLWAACDSEPPTGPGEVEVEAAYQITDATTSDTDENDYFYWLPPMVSQPEFGGTFAPDINPSVEICRMIWYPDPADPDNEKGEWDCYGPSVRSFSRNSGIEVDVHGQHYQVNWKTDEVVTYLMEDPDEPGKWIPTQGDPIATGLYRINVLVGPPGPGRLLGFADVYVDKNAKNFRNLDSSVGETVGLIDGSTLPIKFRIERTISKMPLFDAVMQSDREVNFDVFLLDSRSGSALNLTQNPGLDGTPNWSPDGSKIIFASNRADPANPLYPPDIYTMNPDGSDVQLLAENGWQPEYSPDGSWIVFQRGWPPEPHEQAPGWGCPAPGLEGNEHDQCGRQHDIWILDPDNPLGIQIQLTDEMSKPPYDGDVPSGYDQWYDLWEDWSPTWHPTKNWVTFGRYRNDLMHEVQPGINCDGPFNPPSDQEWWDDPQHYCHFDVVSIDVTDPASPVWIRHTYALQRDQLDPRWAPYPTFPEGNILTLKINADDGVLVAFYPPNAKLQNFPGTAKLLTPWFPTPEGPIGTEDANITWSPTGPEVLFSSTRTGSLGIFKVPNWNGWLLNPSPPGGTVGFPQVPLVVVDGQTNAGARFRPSNQ